MKIALLITGEFREFEIAHKFWPFLQWEGIDIYFSLWSTSEIYFSDELVETELINYQLINSVNPKNLCIEIQPSKPMHNALKMIHRVKKGFEMIINSGIEYDIVITVRPDFISYVKNEYYLEQVQKSFDESVCLIDGISDKSSGDSFIIYPIKYVFEYLDYDFTQHIGKSTLSKYRIDIHYIYCQFFKDKAKSMDYLTTRWTIVRPNSRKLSPLQQRSFRIISEFSGEWWLKRNKFIPAKLIYDPDCT